MSIGATTTANISKPEARAHPRIAVDHFAMDFRRQRIAFTTPVNSTTAASLVFFDDAALVLVDLRIDQRPELRFEAFVGAVLISSHQV